jgi:antitoxin CptB
MDHHPTTASAVSDAEARRLLWRCRRGMKELDILLERFARRELPNASSGQRSAFARFLDLPDPLLVDYLLGQVIPPEAELAELARRITAPTAPSAARSARSSESMESAAPMAVAGPVRHDPASKRPP